MPQARIFNKAGELVALVDGPPDQIKLNVPKGGRFEVVPPGVDLFALMRAGPPGRPRRRRKPKEAAP